MKNGQGCHHLLFTTTARGMEYTQLEKCVLVPGQNPRLVPVGRSVPWAVLNALHLVLAKTPGTKGIHQYRSLCPYRVSGFVSFPFLFSFFFLFHSIAQCITNFRITESHFTRVTTITRFHYTRIKILFDKSQESQDYTTITTFHFTVFTRLHKNHKMLTRFHFSLPFSGYRFFIPNIQFKEGPLPLLLLLG